MKKIKRHAKRHSKIDRIVEATAQDHKDASTDDITRRRTVLACQASVLEHEIVATQAKLAIARAARAEVEATMRGLASVVGKR